MNNWEKAQVISKIIGAIALPIVILFVGGWIDNAIKSREINTKYVELAINILKEQPQKENTNLRQWAFIVMNRYSEIKLSEDIGNALINKMSLTSSGVSIFVNVIDNKNAMVSNAKFYLYGYFNGQGDVVLAGTTDERGNAYGSTTIDSTVSYGLEVRKNGFRNYQKKIKLRYPSTYIKVVLEKIPIE